jgi:hypothetical protein
MSSRDTPILILIFNRPHHLEKVIEKLKLIKPSVIYIAGDGPREANKTDLTNVLETRQKIQLIDWSCEVKTFFQEKNLGCRSAVTIAIDWFFENVEEGIILEDDCIPDPSFFEFANQMLIKYRYDSRLMSIGGQHFAGSKHKIESSYFFSRHVHCWGWATWKRAWQLNDRNMNAWPNLSKSNWLYKLGGNNLLFERYWTNIFNDCFNGKIDSWAYRWLFSCWAQNGLSILPSVNLVTNIGFGKDSTHTSKGNSFTENLPLQKMVFPLKHPTNFIPDFESDKWTDNYVFGITIWKMLKVRLAKISLLYWLVKTIKSNVA